MVLNTFHIENMHNSKFQVHIGQIVHVRPEIFGISCKNAHILVFLYVQIRECDTYICRFHVHNKISLLVGYIVLH